MKMEMIKEVLGEVWLEQHALPGETAHEFSRRHNEKMVKIFARRFGHMTGKSKKKLPFRKRLLIALMVILLAVCSVTVGASLYNGFSYRDYSDHRQLFSANNQNCPKSIENVYYLSEIPEGYTLYEQIKTKTCVATDYRKNGRGLTFDQIVKERYFEDFDNENCIFEEFELDGHPAIYWHPKDEEKVFGSIVWDNGDYILEVCGDFDKQMLEKLARSAKIS